MQKSTLGISNFVLKSPSFPGILLLVCVAASLLLANSSAGETFAQLLAKEVGFNSGTLQLRFNLSFEQPALLSQSKFAILTRFCSGWPNWLFYAT